MATITADGFPTIEPLLVLGYRATRRTRTIIHDSIAPTSESPPATLYAAALRTGTLTLLFDNQDAAMDCFDRHGQKLIFRFEHEQRHTWAMFYVAADGDLEIELDDERKLFTVSIPFVEVTR